MDVDPQTIINSVQCTQYAQALLDHERRKKVKNTSGAYYYIDQQGNYALLKGLLPRLSQVFWPTTNSAYRQMSDMKTRPLALPPSSVRQKTKKKGRGRYQGVITGTEVHRQLRDFVVLDEKNFRKIHGSLHPYCSRLLSVIVNHMKWQLFLPEFDIYDEFVHIGTSIDMVCLDQAGRLILLEFKTGYKDYFDGADGYMHQSLSAMRNTRQNQATLQVTSAAQILHQRYDVPLEQMRLYVLRIDDESLDIIPIDPLFVKKVGQYVYKDLLDSMNGGTVTS